MKRKYLTHSLLVLLFVLFALSGATVASAAATVPARAGKVTEYSIPTALSFPEGITTGPDGNLWFAEYKGHKIGRITPSGSFTEFPLRREKRRGPLDITT